MLRLVWELRNAGLVDGDDGRNALAPRDRGLLQALEPLQDCSNAWASRG